MPRRRHKLVPDPFLRPPERRGRPAAQRSELSDVAISGLIPSETEFAVHDAVVPGLFVRVRQNGTKSFAFRPKGRGTKRARALGKCSDMTVSQARAKALSIEHSLENGVSFRSIGSPKRRSIEQAYTAYVATFDEDSAWSKRIAREFDRTFLPIIGDLGLADLTCEQAIACCRGRRGFYGERNLLNILSSFLTWAVRTGRIERNVLKGRRTAVHPAPREPIAMEGTSLRLIWEACEQLDDPWKLAFRLVIATGASMAEILSLPTNVCRDPCREPFFFTGLAEELLRGQPPSGPFLFAAPGKSQPRAFQHSKLKQLREKSSMQNFTLGDLRRGTVAILAESGRRSLEWDDFLPTTLRADPADQMVEL